MEKYVYKKENLPQPILPEHPEWIDLYYRTWELAFDNVEYIEQDGWKPQMTCMPGVNTVWQWDSCLMTFITNYANGSITALNNLDNLYRLRREEDGYMSMAYRINTELPAWPGRINPPLMAWAEWESYLISGDKERLQRVLPALEGNYQFLENNRRRVSGLYWFEDPGSTGMDNSPRGPYAWEPLDGAGICHIDLGCQQSLSAKCLANICDVLGDDEKAAFYRNENVRINDLINRFHWCESVGFYFDFFGRSGAEKKVKYINSKTAAAFWAVICGAADGRRLERMLEHILNPNEFYTKVPFATLSADDPNYDSNGGYWLGGVWAPTNFALIRGLAENGRGELAREAAIRYLNAICAVAGDPAYGNTIWECYSPSEYRPATAECGEIVRADFVGWSGLAPTTMLIENIIGLSFDAKSNVVTFRMFPNQLCGLKNMHFNGNTISIECKKYIPVPGKSLISVSAEKEFTLIVKNNYSWQDTILSISGGVQDIMV